MAEDWAAQINGGQDEDEALRMAIAMSLGQDLDALDQGKKDAIDLTEKEDMAGESPAETASQPSQDLDQPTTSAMASAPARVALDRKQMELERLERLRKRKAEDAGATDDPGASRPTQRPTLRTPSSLIRPNRLVSRGPMILFNTVSSFSRLSSSSFLFPEGMPRSERL